MTPDPGHFRRAPLHRLLRCALVLSVVATAAACNGDDASAEQEYVSVMAFDTVPARIITDRDTFHLRVEMADREDLRAHGLMERTSLAEDAGMVFLYRAEQPADGGFWMYRTRIPLDIAYFDDTGTIVSIVSMEPCHDPDPRSCPNYPAGVPYHGALEVNSGYFAQRGIGLGARIVVDR